MFIIKTILIVAFFINYMIILEKKILLFMVCLFGRGVLVSIFLGGGGELLYVVLSFYLFIFLERGVCLYIPGVMDI